MGYLFEKRLAYLSACTTNCMRMGIFTRHSDSFAWTRVTSADEKDLFNIANNFGKRHRNDKQRTAYDAGIWFSWMFYFYLSTIHVVLRKMGRK